MENQAHTTQNISSNIYEAKTWCILLKQSQCEYISFTCFTELKSSFPFVKISNLVSYPNKECRWIIQAKMFSLTCTLYTCFSNTNRQKGREHHNFFLNISSGLLFHWGELFNNLILLIIISNTQLCNRTEFFVFVIFVWWFEDIWQILLKWEEKKVYISSHTFCIGMLLVVGKPFIYKGRECNKHLFVCVYLDD